MTLIDEPPCKLQKLDDNLAEFKVLPLLDSSILSPYVPTTSFYALELNDKKLIGIVIKLVNELPERLRHLKRVGKEGKILIAETIEESEVVYEKLKELGISKTCLTEIQVPAIKPVTRRQFEYAKSLWSTSFNADKEVENLLSGEFLTPELKNYISKYSEMASSIECIAVQNKEILCTGSSNPGPLRHPVMEMVRNLPKREANADNYLGTGCDIFLKNEPCAMCAMALVHFRVKRIFFNSKSSNGVLSSGGWQLHLEPAINHHYQVFHVVSDKSENF
ncbi:unnamed protein product [Caenorhabditis bovis]|uniref:CMP/dCMP-type deaminase domain-containing protein n=1 Tax=Caenorhabditis bovis TaxID=2654633 RepID=A0A8S1EKG9_9PELO|nr:unnamed protein product [Caenorhabditis bovis]